MIIAIDGPAAAGKGTLAKAIAAKLGYALLDTGLLYRAVGMKVLKQGVNPADQEAAAKVAEGLTPTDLEADGLRTDDAAQAASKVAAIPAVRAHLLDFQRSFAKTPPPGLEGSILDGRDIGTVVCPDADAKLFVTASTEVRAERRLKELQKAGIPAIYATVLDDMKARDERDQNRSTAPLVAADDAYQLDTSGLTADEVLEKALEFLSSKGISVD